jgi:hypothetical protein
MIFIKNISGEVLQLHLHEFQIDESYQIPDIDRTSWARNDSVILAISNAVVQIYNDDAPIDSISDQIKYLQDNTPKEVLIQNRIEARTVNCVSGRKLHARYVSFTTADQDNFDNTGVNNQDFGDVDYKMYKWVEGVRTLTTTNSEAEETWIIFQPSFSFEISGGDVDVPSELPVDQSSDLNLWELHVVGNISLEIGTSGAIPRTDLIANPRAKFKVGQNVGVDSSINPAEMPYNDPALSYPLTGGYPFPTNEIVLVVKHPAGKQAEFQLHLQLYK